MSFYTTNMTVLSKRFPGLAENISSKDPSESNLHIEQARSGDPTCSINGTFLHSKYNPRQEAERVMQSFSGKNHVCGIFLGFGLGYQIEAFMAMYPDSVVILVEPDESLFCTALEGRNLQHIFMYPSIACLIGSGPEALYSVLPSVRNRNILVFPNSGRAAAGTDFSEYTTLIQQFITKKEINNNTLRKFGPLWVRNLLKNFSIGKIHGGIDSIENLFPDSRCLVLAGGPSLDLCVDKIKDLSRDSLLICVDTAVTFLRIHDLVPDFIVTVDPQYYNSRHFDWHTDPAPVLIAESSTSSRTIRNYDGIVLCGASFFPLGTLLEQGLISKKLGAGGSVATAAFDFARFVGAKSIVLAGLDLGYIENRTHYSGSFIETAFAAKSTKISTNETYNIAIMESGEPVSVQAYSGSNLKSDKRLQLYLWWFEQQVQNNCSLKVFSLSAQSTRIRGVQTISDNLDLIPGNPVSIEFRRNEIKKRLNYSVSKFGADLSINFSNKINQLRQDFEKIKADALHAVFSLTEFLTIPEPDSADKDTITKILSGTDRKLAENEAKEIISFLLQDEIIEIEQNYHNDPYRRSIQLYEKIVHAAEYHLRILQFSQK